MSVYTVCGEFVRECCLDEYYALNVLFEFVKDNEKRVAVDRANKRIIKIYGDICKSLRSKHMSVWLKQLAANQNRNVELITADVSEADEKGIFLSVAMRAPKPRKFIVWSLDHYPDSDAYDDLVCLDREGAKKDISQVNPESKSEEAIRMTKYNVTAGDGSNIIIGSRLKDSVHHLSTNVSKESAKLLKAMADCIESSGSAEAGETFDQLASELQKEKKSRTTVMDYVGKIFQYVPDMARIGKTVQDTVEILLGSGS